MTNHDADDDDVDDDDNDDDDDDGDDDFDGSWKKLRLMLKFQERSKMDSLEKIWTWIVGRKKNEFFNG